MRSKNATATTAPALNPKIRCNRSRSLSASEPPIIVEQNAAQPNKSAVILFGARLPNGQANPAEPKELCTMRINSTKFSRTLPYLARKCGERTHFDVFDISTVGTNQVMVMLLLHFIVRVRVTKINAADYACLGKRFERAVKRHFVHPLL